MVNPQVSISAFASISSLGSTEEEIWERYKNVNTRSSVQDVVGLPTVVSHLSEVTLESIKLIKSENQHYRNLDNSVLYALFAARQVFKKLACFGNPSIGINIGSSRGATNLFERYHQEFIKTNKAATLSSPTTTLGNISSWIAHDLQTTGPDISHSITCSTALHSVLNGIAWLRAGMADKFLVGGSEAPLTPFTISQMKALKIYSSHLDSPYPCQALNLAKTKNTMFLGEGAAVACLELGITENTLATIVGIGYATEPLQHHISISSDANCFQKSMRMALRNIEAEAIDVIVTHTPGTIKGDLSEYKAIQAIFKSGLPAITTNKWKIGHTFGASGMLSLEFALLMLKYQTFIPVPYLNDSKSPHKLKTIMVNAVGFGGNAVSIIIQKPNHF